MSDPLVFSDEYGNPHDDALSLDNYLDNFHILVTKTKYSVYSLTGSWGSGKTTFIKIWEKYRLKGTQYIHIDAFEMDYLSDPFIMLIKHFNDYLRKNKIDEREAEEFINKAKKIARIAAKSIGNAVVNIVADKTIGKDNIKEILSEIYNGAFNEFVEDSEPISVLYKQLRNAINKIIEKLDDTLFIIIDELDRCRPSFALEVIEKIKHIFILPKIKFILVLNEKVLESMIEKEYNLKNDGQRYLQKFIQKRIPYEPNPFLIHKILKMLSDDREDFKRVSYSSLLSRCLNNETVTDLQKQFGVSLSDFDFLFSNFKMHVNYSTEIECLIIFSLEVLKLIDNENYSNLENNVIITNGFKTVDNQYVMLLYKILLSLKSSLKIDDIGTYVVKYFQHEYN